MSGKSREDYATSETTTVDLWTDRGPHTVKVIGWATKDESLTETNGAFTESTPASGTPSASRSAHAVTTSAGKSHSETTDTADSVRRGGGFVWHENGTITTIADATEGLTDTADYSTGTAGDSRDGSYTKYATSKSKTDGKWFSSGEFRGQTLGEFGPNWPGYGLGLLDEADGGPGTGEGVGEYSW